MTESSSQGFGIAACSLSARHWNSLGHFFILNSRLSAFIESACKDDLPYIGRSDWEGGVVLWVQYSAALLGTGFQT